MCLFSIRTKRSGRELLSSGAVVVLLNLSFCQPFYSWGQMEQEHGAKELSFLVSFATFAPSRGIKSKGARTLGTRSSYQLPAASLPQPTYAAFFALAFTSITLLAARLACRVACLRMFVSCLPSAVLLPTAPRSRSITLLNSG